MILTLSKDRYKKSFLLFVGLCFLDLPTHLVYVFNGSIFQECKINEPFKNSNFNDPAIESSTNSDYKHNMLPMLCISFKDVRMRQPVYHLGAKYARSRRKQACSYVGPWYYIVTVDDSCYASSMSQLPKQCKMR